MRLYTYIFENLDCILQRWEGYAREIWPGINPSITDLRDHAEEMLLAIVADMQTPQSEAQRHDKSVGKGWPSKSSEAMDLSSAKHAVGRVDSGFDIRALVAEYRALRASVLHLWSQEYPDMVESQIEDITRFNESLDQLLAESVLSYTTSVEQSRELLLGILGHDLRSPLGVVTVIAGLLEESQELSPSTRHMVTQIVISAREMKRLVVDLLDFAGSRMGAKIHVTRQKMDLEELCREVLEEIKAANPSRVFELEISTDGKGEWDRPRLRQLVSNLLVNAVQHGVAHAPIRLFIRSEGDAVVFGVSNQGPVISPAMQAVMFDPLRRGADDNLTRPMGSLGLGLYIAREVAVGHGGVIEVISDDHETSFIVKMPRMDKFQHKPTNHAEANGPDIRV